MEHLQAKALHKFPSILDDALHPHVGEVLVGAEVDEEHPFGQLGDELRVGQVVFGHQRSDIDVVQHQEFVTKAQADEPVGGFEQLCRLVRGDEERLLAIGDEFASSGRPGDDAQGALRCLEHPMER